MNANARPESTALSVSNSSASAGSLLMDSASMDRLERIADLMASGNATVPKHFQRNRGDCFAIVLQSMQWGMNPFSVAQKTFQVSGVLGYEAQLVASVINSSGLITDRFKFEWFGPWEKIIGKFKTVESKTKKDDNGNAKTFIVPDWRVEDEKGLGINVSATIRGEKEPRVLTLLMTQARTRNSTLWTEDPKQQIAYLAQKRWARLYAPDVILGVYTPDELEEPAERHMGMVEEVKPEPKGYDQAKYDANFPTWKEVIEQGRKTADDLINFAASRSTPYTDEQIKRLRAVKVVVKEAPTDVEVKPPVPAEPVTTAPLTAATSAVTYAQVAAALNAARSQNELADAAELIGEVASPEHRAELVALNTLRATELAPY